MTSRTVDVSGYYTAVCVTASGDFIVVGWGGRIYTSSDGVTFTARTSGVTSDLWGVCAHPTDALYVAVGGGGRIITATSITGAWTARTSGTGQDLKAVVWSAARSVFIAVGDNGTILSSPNGIAWTVETSGVTQTLYSVSANSLVEIVGGYNGLILTNTP